MKRLRRIVTGEKYKPPPLDAQELRLEFRSRYHWFRRLLRANRAALEDMALIQEILHSERPVGMVRVRTICARVSLEVWKIVDSMRRLAPGKYQDLDTRLARIRAGIEILLQPAHSRGAGPLVVDLGQVGLKDRHLLGSKLAMLGEVNSKLGLDTPPGFAVTSAGFWRFMQENELGEEIERRIRAAAPSGLDDWHALSSDLQALIMNTSLPSDLEEEFRAAASRYFPPLAVRSSALSEDDPGASFAGLHRSILNVGTKDLIPAFKEVVASLFSPAAMAYRFHMGIPDQDAVMCTGCLEMVQARTGGVLYTRDPLGQNPGAVLNSVWGLPKPVVEGRCRGDLFKFSEDGQKVLEAEAEGKNWEYLAVEGEGVARNRLGAKKRAALSVSREEALAVAECGRKMEETFGGPLDVEWVITPQEKIVVLQVRFLHSGHRPGRKVLPGEEKDILARGQTASFGVGSGPVRVVRKGADMLDFPEGSVLVTTTALPRLASLLGRAAGVVAETGSLAGHLATICREYEVPAVFGVPRAAEIFSDGQEVTVNADTGTVLDGGQEIDPAEPGKAVAKRANTPVHKVLQEAAALITPLYLTDPGSPHFRARNVHTYHDITRFCHEKAIQEMFSFGREHDFPERSSKQLVYNNTRTRWWVLNLDDGFKTEVRSSRVRLEDIACTPMLAIWEGVVALPWEGPPPVNAGGLLSVFFRSTQQSSLDPGSRSAYTERNYFMISRDYCSLSSRLGYHLSSIESLITGRPGENYALFRFQGGAADDERRSRRVDLISGLLEDHGFVCETRADNLHASIQGLPDADMLRALKLLGFLNIHTRQIDMALTGRAEAEHYSRKLRHKMDQALRPAPREKPG